MKYQVNPNIIANQSEIVQLLENIDELFASSDIVLQDARNKIKTVRYKECNYVVKSFKRPNFLNRLLYSFLRSSKAKRSYDYSLRIADFVPQGIGYLEHYQHHLLTSSYFVSELFEYDFTIRAILTDSAYPDRNNILKEFAQYSYNLHQQGILHKDFSPGNILIKRQANSYLFKIIDINRMQFKTLSLKERMYNFSKLWARDEDLAIITAHYALLGELDERECQKLAIRYNQRNKSIKNFKKRLKGRPVKD